MHYIQRKQFIETNLTLNALQQISDLNIFLKASAGHWKRCGRPHSGVAKGEGERSAPGGTFMGAALWAML